MATRFHKLVLSSLILTPVLSCAAPPGAESSNAKQATSLAFGPYSLTFTGSGFDHHNEQALSALLMEDGKPKVKVQTTMFDGAFAVRWYGVLLEGKTYSLSYFADVNGNGKCDSPPVDHVWRASVNMDESGDSVVEVQHNKDFIDSCPDFASPGTPAPPTSGAFDLTVTGAGYTSHVGETVNAALLDSTGAVVSKTTFVIQADAMIRLMFPGAVKTGQTYKVAYYADHNKNGLCDAPSAATDHSWSANVPAVSGPTTVDSPHVATFTPSCMFFGDKKLTINGTGYTPHAGQSLYIDVVDAATNAVVVGPEKMAVLAAGTWTFTWPAPLTNGKAYVVRYFADVNGNRICDTAPTDHTWETPIPAVNADVTLAVTHNTTFVNTVCPSFGTAALP